MYTSILPALVLLGISAQVLAQGTLASYASYAPETTGEPTPDASSPVSSVKGAAFQRFVQIWLENVVSLVQACDIHAKPRAEVCDGAC